MQQFETEFKIYPFDIKGPTRHFNLLLCSRTSHPSFTDTDSLVKVDLQNAEAALPTDEPRVQKWQLKGGATLTLNTEIGGVVIDGDPEDETLDFMIVRADLNRA